jgi:hypothetical protein
LASRRFEMSKVPVFGTLPNGNYPFLALQREGQRPFVIRRDKFLTVLRSIEGREITWEIVREPEKIQSSEDNPRDPEKPFRNTGYRHVVIGGGIRDKLVITHRNGRGHGVVKFYNVLDAGVWPLMRQCESWHTATMRQHGRCPCWEFQQGGTCKRLLWHRQRWLRRAIQARVGQWRHAKEKKSTAKLYKQVNELLAATHGQYPETLSYLTEVRQWSKLNTAGKREFKEDFDVYLDRLWKACGLVSKPEAGWSGDETWGPERYVHWLHNLHKRKELQEMIDALKMEDGL